MNQKQRKGNYARTKIDTTTTIAILATGALINDVDELAAAIEAIIRVMPNVQMILLV